VSGTWFGRSPVTFGEVAFLLGSMLAIGMVVHGQTADGKTVLAGVYTREQANRGDAQYSKACASCHLADLSGEHTAPPLAGDTFIQQYVGLTVADLFERIRTTMPQNAIGSLSDAACLDVVAFLLQANGFRSGAEPLPNDVDALRHIAIKAREER